MAIFTNNGTAANPAITNTNDTNTGVFYPAADTIALSANGVEAARITSQGIVDYYKKSNILGTVSLSGGVPTGAVIERGSNANGIFIKYADGTMIASYSGPTNISGVYPQVHEWPSYPAQFSGVPLLLAQGISWRGQDISNYHYSEVRMAGRSDISNGLPRCRIESVSRDGGNPTNSSSVRWFALGSWA